MEVRGEGQGRSDCRSANPRYDLVAGDNSLQYLHIYSVCFEEFVRVLRVKCD